MDEHPIEGLMITAMNSIQDMVDVNTIIGEPIETSNNIVIIPISKVCFGFVAGGSEFKGETIDEYTKKDKEEAIQYRLPFGGGSGSGVNISPVAFLVVQGNNVKLLPVNHASSIDRLLDYVPDLVERVNKLIDKTMQDKKEEKKEEKKERKEEKKEQNKKEGQETNKSKNQTKARPRRNRGRTVQEEVIEPTYNLAYEELEPDDVIEFENMEDTYEDE